MIYARTRSQLKNPNKGRKDVANSRRLYTLFLLLFLSIPRSETKINRVFAIKFTQIKTQKRVKWTQMKDIEYLSLDD